MWVVVLLAYGCPLQAIVKAFDFDERTVKNWWQRAGAHCQGVHEAVIASQQYLRHIYKLKNARELETR